MGNKIIVAKTRLRKLPKTCKECSVARSDSWTGDRFCGASNRICPMEVTPSGRVAYCKPSWCPLVEIDKDGDNNG